MGNVTEFETLSCAQQLFTCKNFLGKYLGKNSGESIWTQKVVFGPNVVQSVLDGTHYVRS